MRVIITHEISFNFSLIDHAFITHMVIRSGGHWMGNISNIGIESKLIVFSLFAILFGTMIFVIPIPLVLGQVTGTIDINGTSAGAEWNSGMEILVTLTDTDANANHLFDEDLDVFYPYFTFPDFSLIPTLTTGTPFTLENLQAIQVGPTLLTVVDVQDISQRAILRVDSPITFSNGDIIGFILNDTYSDLYNSIHDPAGSFSGNNYFNYDVRSLAFNVTGGTILSVDISLGGPVSVATLATSAPLQGIVNLVDATGDDIFGMPGTDNVFINFTVNTAGAPQLFTNQKLPIVTDFFSYGIIDDGVDSSERIANQIIRFELEETGDNTSVFAGTVEYTMVNQLNVLSRTFMDSAIVPINVSPKFVVIEGSTGSSAPTIMYNDLDNGGQHTPISDSQDAPSHTGTISFDQTSYTYLDTVPVILEDQDLNTDSDVIDFYTVVNPTTGDAASDTVGAAGLPVLSFWELGNMLEIQISGERWINGLIGSCGAAGSPDDGLFSTGFTLVESGTGTGIFTGDFQVPNDYCKSSTGTITTPSEFIESTYTDFRTSTNEIATTTDTALLPSNITSTIELNSEQYEVNTGEIVTVTDSAANLNPLALDTVSVQMTSTTDETGFNVTSTETDVDTGIFVSPQIVFSSAATNAGLNILNAPAGSTVFANYNPTDSATIVCSGCGVGAIPPAVRFNSDLYEHETSGALHIDDSTRNTNAGAVDLFTIGVNSTANPGGILVTMVEDAINSGKFVSSPLITFTRTTGIPAPYLLVNDLDTITLLNPPYVINLIEYYPTARIVPPFSPPQQGNIVGPGPPALACDNDVDGTGNSDNDNDGICDLWEFQGGAHPGAHTGLEITFGGDFYQYVEDNGDCKPLIDDPAASPADDAAYGTLDDTPFCPDPNKKDIFAEIDYMTGHKPDASALRKVVEAFATAPSTLNPPGPTYPVYGINLHLLVDGDIAFHQVSLPEDAVISGANPHGGFKQIKQSNFMTAPERAGLAGDVADILTAKRQVFHYVLFAHNNADNPGSGVAERGGNDVIMSLGEFDNLLGSPDQQAGTLMHELGHNVNLRHGGNVDTPVCKPNYVSVMNYGFQMSNIVPGRPLDFSRSELPMMAESSLSEPVGFARTSPPGLKTVFGGVDAGNAALSRVVNSTNDATMGLAINATHVLVTDPGNNRIQVMTTAFATPVAYGAVGGGTGNAQYKSPEGIATGEVSGTKFIYVADTANNRIKKLSSSGVFVAKTVGTVTSTANTKFNTPEGIAVDSANFVYVADSGNNRIQKFIFATPCPAGTTQTSTGICFKLKIPATGVAAGTADGLFNSPRAVAVDSAGNIYVADTGNHRIQKFNSAGTFQDKVGSYGSNSTQFISPRGIAVAGTVVYVADTGNNRIQKFDATTLDFVGGFGSPGTTDGLLNSPEGIAVDSEGNIYVADTANIRIQKFDSNGVFIAKVGVPGIAAGQFSINTPVAVDYNRNGVKTNTGVSQPIHVLGISGCIPSLVPPTPPENIYGYNDWINVDLFFRDDALFSDGFSDFDTLVELTPGDNNALLSSNIIALDELLFSFDPDVDFPQPPDQSLTAQDAIHADLLAANSLIISGDLEGAIPILDVNVRAGIFALPLVPDDPDVLDAEDIRAELFILLDIALAALNSATEDAIASQIFADDDAATTNQGVPVDISVLTNDGSDAGDTITLDSFTQGTKGGVTDNGDGTLKYTPNAGQSGADSFNYTISNVAGQTDSATVTITNQVPQSLTWLIPVVLSIVGIIWFLVSRLR